MDEELLPALIAASIWLEEHGYQYAVVGGVANEWWDVRNHITEVLMNHNGE